MVAAIGTGIGLVSVWIGLVLSAMFNLPPSFFIVALAVLAWVVVLALTGRRRAPLERPLVDTHHPH
jgi:zinc/manganese transport system permease protein